MRIAVLGPGGVGGLLAALLARQGHDVTCLAGAETTAHINAYGVQLRSERFGQVTAAVRADTRLQQTVDACLVTVKATQLEAALDRVPADVLGTALLVPFLNGVEHVGRLRERFPTADTVAATIRVSAVRTSPGCISHNDQLAAVELAFAGSAPADRFAAGLAAAGVDVRVRPDEAGMLWDKLSFLAPLALLTTYENAPVGTVRERAAESLRALVHEVAAVARAEGAPGDAASTLAFFDQVPATLSSSMQRDAVAGNPTELEAIGGAVLRAAQRHRIEVPVVQALVTELRQRLGGLPARH